MDSAKKPFRFVLRDDRKFIGIPGTKFISVKDQVLLSSGVNSLDSLLGGGLQVGSILLIEEDEFAVFSKYLVKYFLAEGVACKHCLYVSSLDCNVQQLACELPSPVALSEPSDAVHSSGSADLKIAWRYQDTPLVQSAPPSSGAAVFGHNFDLTTSYPKDIIDNTEVSYWPPSWPPTEEYENDPYKTLLHDLLERIQKQGHSTNNPQPRRTVLRVAIHRLGSPLWPDADCRLAHFLYCLRQIIHTANATAVVTLATSLLKQATVERCEHLSDNVVRLQSLANNANPAYSEYNGLLSVVKLATKNTLAAHVPDTLDWAFKLRKKKFVVEKLHLPPELQDSTQREQDDGAALSCATSKSPALDF